MLANLRNWVRATDTLPWGMQTRLWSKPYRVQVEQAAANIGRLADTTSLVVMIPASVRDEHTALPRALNEILRQKASADSYEVIVLLNQLGNREADLKPYQQWAATAAMNHKGKQVSIIGADFPADRLNLSKVRSFLSDITILRAHEARRSKPLFGLQTDADLTFMHPECLSYYQQLFDSDPKLIAVSGRLEYDRKLMLQDPQLWMSGTSFYKAAHVFARSNGLQLTPGPNLCFRFDAFIKAEGYDHRKHLGEDVQVCFNLKSYAKSNGLTVRSDLSRKSLVMTSPRRAAHSITTTGKGAECQWHSVAFKSDDEARSCEKSETRLAWNPERYSPTYDEIERLALQPAREYARYLFRTLQLNGYHKSQCEIETAMIKQILSKLGITFISKDTTSGRVSYQIKKHFHSRLTRLIKTLAYVNR